ncbi:SDR family oxidoreductase [Rhodococcus erythropolis]|uniref:SDR family oxidoreductase n=1 Tax=Rhodococcus erythropolis TaxID=1833 RepID=UPI0038732C17
MVRGFGRSVGRGRTATPLGRLGEADDIPAIVAMLVSHDARWITGQVIHAGGGSFRRAGAGSPDAHDWPACCGERSRNRNRSRP